MIIESKMEFNTNNLNNVVKEFKSHIKDYFYIDIDNLNWDEIVLTYAKLYARLLSNDITDWKKELEYKKLFRVMYSSSKTGVHIKVNLENNIFENIYYRALFEDDINRLRLDILRLNNQILTYDLSFKQKTNKGITKVKDFEFINPLEKLNMKKKTFYKLISYIQQNNQKKISLVMNSHKNNYKKVYTIAGNQDKILEFDEKDIANFEKLLIKYANHKHSEINLKDNYATELPIELCKAVYRYAKFN